MSSLDWNKTFENSIPVVVGAILTGAGWLLFFYRKTIIKWFRRVKLILFPVNFNIALSLDFKDGLNSGVYFEEIKKKLLQTIDDAGMRRYIRLRDFSDIKKFSGKSEAESFRSKKNIDLIIWGNFSTDSLKKDGKDISEMVLNFTYGHPDNKQRAIGAALDLEFSTKFAKKNYWQVIDSNSYEDLKVITNNIFDIAIYILATTLLLYGKIGKSINLFERLYNNLITRHDAFANDIMPRLYDAYWLVTVEIAVRGKRYDIGKKYCQKILEIKKDDFFGLSNLSSFQYWTGEQVECEKTIELLLNLYPKNPLTEVNVAFIRVLQKNYTNAHKHYQNLTSMSGVNFNPQEVIEFLGYEYEKRKEPAILYASGVISNRFGDQQLAKKDLHQFLQLANEETYKPMCRTAKQTLKKLRHIA